MGKTPEFKLSTIIAVVVALSPLVAYAVTLSNRVTTNESKIEQTRELVGTNAANASKNLEASQQLTTDVAVLSVQLKTFLDSH